MEVTNPTAKMTGVFLARVRVRVKVRFRTLVRVGVRVRVEECNSCLHDA